MTAHEVLVKARNLIADEKDWQKGTRPGEGHCTINACSAAAADGIWMPALEAIRDALGFSIRADVYMWNDAPERTHAEVLAAFDKAIAATAPEPDVSFVTEPVAVA